MGTVKAYAKINLYLDVISRNADGFHDVESIMQTVSLSDSVCVYAQPAKTNKITLKCNVSYIPTDKRNIAWQAADLFLKESRISANVDISIEKNIPVAAGMAGGSSDAAAVLTELNRLLSKPFSVEKLVSLGASLGADIPFCMIGGTKLCYGRGDVIKPCSAMPHCYIVVAKGGKGVSTPAVYSKLDILYDNFAVRSSHGDLNSLVKSLDSAKSDITSSFYNIFETAVLPEHKEATEIKEILESSGGTAMMSGSGPSVFAVFKNKCDAEAAAEIIARKGYFSAVCEPIGEYN